MFFSKNILTLLALAPYFANRLLIFDRLVLTHKDRLLRFGAELIFSLCENFGIEVVIVNKTEASTFEDDLVQDVLEIITVFSARLYGARSRKNKEFLDTLREAAEKL